MRRNRKNDKIKDEKELELAFDFRGTELTLGHYIGTGLWLGWFLGLPCLLLLLYILWYIEAKEAFYLISTLLLIATLYPVKRHLQPQWGWKLGKFSCISAIEYFGCRLYYTDRKAVANSGPAMFVLEPHGVMPLGIMALTDYVGANKGHKNVGCVTGAAFYAPILKQMFTWNGAESCDRDNVLRLMKEGWSPTICPGGVAEVGEMHNADKECVLFLKKRKGTVKLALQFGRPIVPIFNFGIHKSYRCWVPKSETFVWLGRKLGGLPILFLGLWNIPFFIPKPEPVTVVMGTPIFVPQINPDDSDYLIQVDKYHNQLLDAYEKLYTEHHEKFDMGEVKLRIV